MVLIITQNYSLVNISNFNHIACITQTDEDGNTNYYIVVDQNIILGQYMPEEIPQIITMIGNVIGKNNSGENLCITMPPSSNKDGDVDAKND